MNGGLLCSGKENDVGSYSGDTPGVTFPGTGFAADTRGIKTNVGFDADTTDVKTGLQCFPLPPLLSCRSGKDPFFPFPISPLQVKPYDYE